MFKKSILSVIHHTKPLADSRGEFWRKETENAQVVPFSEHQL